MGATSLPRALLTSGAIDDRAGTFSMNQHPGLFFIICLNHKLSGASHVIPDIMWVHGRCSSIKQ